MSRNSGKGGKRRGPCAPPNDAEEKERKQGDSLSNSKEESKLPLGEGSKRW